MRILLILLALGLMGLGFAFGALNPESVDVDLFGFDFTLRLGLALLLAAFIGALAAGGLLWLMVLLPLRRRLRKAEFELRSTETAKQDVGA